MCNISILKPGFTPPVNMIENVCYNNPHGFGLILRDSTHNKLQVIRSTKKDLEAGNDPKQIYDLLKKHEDVERYLHVRFKTEGDISLENTQPFCAYNSNSREVYFMHNGTLYDYKPQTGYTQYQHGVKIEPDKSVDSDSKIFNEKFLAPLLNRFSGENGKADIKDPVFGELVAKFWGPAAHNRGLLISSDQGYVLINQKNWETIKTAKGDFLSSNNTYFDKVTRGPVYEQREKERKEREEAERKARFQDNKNSSSSTVQKLKDILLSDTITLPVNIKDLLHGCDIYSHEGIAELTNITHLEWETFTSNQDDTIALLMHLTDEFTKLYGKYDKAVTHLKNIQEKKQEEKEVRCG